MGNKNTKHKLQHKHINKFRKHMESIGAIFEHTKGDYEVLRFTHCGNKHILFMNKKFEIFIPEQTVKFFFSFYYRVLRHEKK